MYFVFDKNLNEICVFDDLGEVIEKVTVEYEDQNKVYFFSGLAKLGESTYVSDKYELINYLDNSNFQNLYKAEGSFSTILLWNNEIKFINDCIQRESFFYYHNEINSLVSNSFLLLASECKKKNIPLTFNEKVAKYQLIEHYFFDQSFSKESLITDISNLIPPQIITSNKNNLSIVKSKEFFLVDESRGYQELLQNSVQSMAQDLLFSSQSYKKVITNLTGGQDSRIIFGVIQTQKSLQNNNFHFNSAIDFEKDFKVASKIADLYGVKLNEKIDLKRRIFAVSPQKALYRWALCNAGNYYYMNLSQDYYPDTCDLLTIRGGGGEVCKGSYDTSYKNFIGNLKRTYPDLYDDGLKEILDNSLSTVESSLDYDDSNYIDMHYFLYRNRIHFGRNAEDTTRWTYFIDPLMNRYLTTAALRSKKDKIYSASIVRDLLLLIDSRLARLEFDNPTKNMTESFLSESTINLDIFQKKLCLKEGFLRKTESSFNKFEEHTWLSKEVLENEVDKLIFFEVENLNEISWIKPALMKVTLAYKEARSKQGYLVAMRRQMAKLYSFSLILKYCN